MSDFALTAISETRRPTTTTQAWRAGHAVGGLRPAGPYRTGGLGGVLGGSAVDHLASQGSLAYDRAGGLLYAVNAGGDTLTVFAVDGDRLVGRQIVPSFGDFPAFERAQERLAALDIRVVALSVDDGGDHRPAGRRPRAHLPGRPQRRRRRPAPAPESTPSCATPVSPCTSSSARPAPTSSRACSPPP